MRARTGEVDGRSPPPSDRRRGRGTPSLTLERAGAIVSLGIAGFILVGAESLVSQSSITRPGVFPAHGALWLGASLLGLASLAWVVQTFRQPARPRPAGVANGRDVLVVFTMLLVGAWSARWLGLLPAAGLTYVVLMLFYRERSWIFVVGSLVGYLLVLHFGMEVLLGVPLAGSPLLPPPF